MLCTIQRSANACNIRIKYSVNPNLFFQFCFKIYCKQHIATKVTNIPVPSQYVLSTETILTPSDAEYEAEYNQNCEQLFAFKALYTSRISRK